MPERKLSGLAQDVRLAREMGLTYGALNAPPVYVRGYAGELYPEICERRKAGGKARKPAPEPDKPPPEVRRCIVCNGPLSERQERFCSRDCAGNWRRQQQGPLYCAVCGTALSGRQLKFCGAVCRSNYHSRKHAEKARLQARYCPNCGRPVTGRKTYCDAVCGNAFRQKRHFERKKAVAASQG